MATRADFYIRKNGVLEFLGSTSNEYYGDWEESTNEDHYRNAVNETLRINNSVQKKWYWPWKNSYISDEVFIFDVKPKLGKKNAGVLLAKVHTEKERSEPILWFLDYDKRYTDKYHNEKGYHYSKDCEFISMPNII